MNGQCCLLLELCGSHGVMLSVRNHNIMFHETLKFRMSYKVQEVTRDILIV